MHIKKFISSIFKAIIRNSKYKIRKYIIDIPPKFALPDYQKNHRLYDRFLPLLVRKLTPNKVIVDVGANIGDTLIAIIQHCENSIICIEPSDVFYSYLERNLKKLTPKDFNRVKIFKKLVGTGLLSGELNHSVHGTAALKMSENIQTVAHTALDELIKDSFNVILLKVDTDGFDFDVIKSAEKVLSDSEPILFWENAIFEDYQLKGFDDLYSLLTTRGYKYIYVFDNFGNLITEEPNFTTLKNINCYLYSMEKHHCTRTFYYTDILAATDKNYLAVKNAINEYKTEWINK